MRSENAIMPSRREFLSDAFGIGLVTAANWPIREGEARSMYGQSDRSTVNGSGRPNAPGSRACWCMTSGARPRETFDAPACRRVRS